MILITQLTIDSCLIVYVNIRYIFQHGISKKMAMILIGGLTFLFQTKGRE